MLFQNPSDSYTVTAYRVDSEKNESLKFDCFGLAHSLTIQLILKYKNVNGLVLIAGCLVPGIASCLETRNSKKWDFFSLRLASVYIKIEENRKSLTSFETLWVVHCCLCYVPQKPTLILVQEFL